MNQIQGGVAAVWAALLNLFFADQGHDLRKSGISLQLHGGARSNIWMQLGPAIADEPALARMYGCKGAAGLKPCLLCANVFNKRFRRDAIAARDVTGWSCLHTESDPAKFVFHTRATLQEIVARLQAPMTKTAREELQTQLGWNLIPQGVVSSDRLLGLADPAEHACFDWMHVLFVSGGVASHTHWLVLQGLGRHGMGLDLFRTYVNSWHQPGRVGSKQSGDMFTPSRVNGSRTAGYLQGPASEQLSLLPILANFCRAIVDGRRGDDEKRHAGCLLLLAELTDYLVAAARHRIPGGAFLRTASAFLQVFRDLFGEDSMTPKFHAILHFDKFLNRWGHVPNCWVLERKHKLSKRYSDPLTDTSRDWESSVLRSCTVHHLEAMAESRWTKEAALIDPHEPKGQLNQILRNTFGSDEQLLVSRALRINEWEICCSRDFVLVRRGGEIVIAHLTFPFCVARNGRRIAFVGVQLYDITEELPRSWKARASRDCWIANADDLIGSLVWSEDGVDIVLLKPARYNLRIE